MPLGALTNWTTTATALHQVSQVLGGLRMLMEPHDPNYLEMAMFVVPEGLTTGKLPIGGEVTLDMQRVKLIYRRGYVETVIPITDRTQADINRDLLAAMRGDLLRVFAQQSPSDEITQEAKQGIKDPDETLVDEFTAAIRAKYPNLNKKITKFAETTRLTISTEIASTYANALYAAFTGISRFRARLTGVMSPLIVYPEHFDLSFMWFDKDPSMDQSKPHLMFGFAPFSEGFPRPYLYAYAYPYPSNMQYPPVPDPAYWNTKQWTGIVVDYEAIAQSDDAALYIEEMCGEIFATLRKLQA